MIGAAASTISAKAKSWVSLRSHPIRKGPAKPPICAIELIRAIAAAAAVPESHAVGSVQNTPKVQNTPIAATMIATIVT